MILSHVKILLACFVVEDLYACYNYASQVRTCEFIIGMPYCQWLNGCDA